MPVLSLHTPIGKRVGSPLRPQATRIAAVVQTRRAGWPNRGRNCQQTWLIRCALGELGYCYREAARAALVLPPLYAHADYRADVHPVEDANLMRSQLDGHGRAAC